MSPGRRFRGPQSGTTGKGRTVTNQRRNPVNWNFNVGPFAWLAAGVGTSMAIAILAVAALFLIVMCCCCGAVMAAPPTEG